MKNLFRKPTIIHPFQLFKAITVLFCMLLSLERIFHWQNYSSWHKNRLSLGPGEFSSSLIDIAPEYIFTFLCLVSFLCVLYFFTRRKSVILLLIYIGFSLVQFHLNTWSYGVLTSFLRIALFYSVLETLVIECGLFFSSGGQESLVSRIAAIRFIMKVHFASIYFFSGIEKAQSLFWTSGTNLYLILGDNIFDGVFIGWPGFTENAIFYKALTFIVIAIEILAPILLFTSWTLVGIGLLATFLLSIIFLLGFSYFGSFALLSLIIFWPHLHHYKNVEEYCFLRKA